MRHRALGLDDVVIQRSCRRHGNNLLLSGRLCLRLACDHDWAILDGKEASATAHVHRVSVQLANVVLGVQPVCELLRGLWRVDDKESRTRDGGVGCCHQLCNGVALEGLRDTDSKGGEGVAQ